MEEEKNQSLVAIEKKVATVTNNISLTGKDLTIQQINSVARNNASVLFSQVPEFVHRIEKSYGKMVEQVKAGVPIYGCNTGYGGRAARIVNQGSPAKRMQLAKEVSEGIAHVDVTVGPLLTRDVVRAAMLIRINMLMQGVSAVKIDDLAIYQSILNAQITPLVSQYGGIGASGDLAHNCRVLSAARQLDGVKVWDRKGNVVEAKVALKKAGIPPSPPLS